MIDDEDVSGEDNEEEDFESEWDGEPYDVDEDTHNLLLVVRGMITMLSNTQVDEQARDNCMIIADTLAERFLLEADDIEVEEIIHGDEILYKPRGGVMGDEEPEAEGPAVEKPDKGDSPSGKA